MKQHSKRFKSLQILLKKSVYSVDSGIKLLKQFNTTNFVESIEAHIKINVSGSMRTQQMRGSVQLPYGTGIQKRVAVYCEPENVSKAKEAGAIIAGFNDLMEDLQKGILNFDILLTTPKLMPQLSKMGKILGPKSLMPSAKSGTLTSNLEEAITEFSKGKMEYRADKTGIIHCALGKNSFSEFELKENIISLCRSLQQGKSIVFSKRNFESFFLCSSMSPSINIDINSIYHTLIGS